ncbi:MAG: hypothetical protein HDT28_02080 [Clostridiales bacterium]|nr:hypothetical protein [Clostridiales bacterium]
MGFCFSKPDKKKLLQESRELVENNARLLAVCKELATGELQDSVERAYNAVKFMTPTAKAGATQVDKKINALAGDLKIALSKSNDRGLLQAEDIIKDLNIAITERNAY